MADPLREYHELPPVDPGENLMKLLQLVSSVFTNAVNQINRIGGADVPLYDYNTTWRDVFRNAGYGQGASTALGLVGDLAEPGPGELKELGNLLPLLAGVIGRPTRGLRGAFHAADEAAEWVEIADEMDRFVNQDIWKKLRAYASASEEDIRDLYEAEGFEAVRAALSGTDWWYNMFPDEEAAYRALHRQLMPTIDVEYHTGRQY